MKTATGLKTKIVTCLTSMLVLLSMILTLVPFRTAFATAVESISLNEQKQVLIEGETEKIFTMTLPDDLYYAVETTGSVDTYITILGLSTGTKADDDWGKGTNACVSFKGEPTTITIKVRGYDEDTYGETTLQVRKQQAVLFGFPYPKNADGIIVDSSAHLEIPASVLSSNYNIKKYNSPTTSGRIMSDNDERGIALYNSEILLFAGHGKETFLGLGLSVSFPDRSFNVDKIIDMHNTKVAVWVACNSAYTDNELNTSLTHKSVEKGADSAIGWTESIYVDSAKKFIDALFTALAEGKDVKEAAEIGKSKVAWYFDAVRNYTLVGKGDTLLTPYLVNYFSLEDSYLIDEFNSRYDANSWIEFADDELHSRYYKTINGIITNDYYDITYDSDNNIINATHSGNYIEEQTVLTDNVSAQGLYNTASICEYTDSLIDYKSYNVYCKIGEVVTPIQIEYNTLKNNDGIVYMDVVCTNLNNGEFIDYADIC